jgi:transposase InsO family protein
MRYIHDVENHPQRDVIEERVKIINFFDKYGEEATREAFGKARSTVFLWKKRLREGGGRLSSLAPLSRAPKRKRKSKISPAVREFIKQYRIHHPGVGKETVKPELDKYCKERGLPIISESTIGRIIKELKDSGEIPVSKTMLSFHARTGKFVIRKTRRKAKKLRRGKFTPSLPGDLLQLDSIVIFLNGIKRYILTAIDLKTKFAFAYAYRSLSSLNASDFMEKLKRVFPFTIQRVQTDNGAEFGKYFKNYIQRHNIIHFHNYPRHPQSNANVERFNRTVQEQHINWHMDELYEVEGFNRGLMKWLIWYNTKRPHKSLNKLAPLRYYIDCFIKDSQQSNMLWTLTYY